MNKNKRQRKEVSNFKIVLYFNCPNCDNQIERIIDGEDFFISWGELGIEVEPCSHCKTTINDIVLIDLI